MERGARGYMFRSRSHSDLIKSVCQVVLTMEKEQSYYYFHNYNLIKPSGYHSRIQRNRVL